MQFFLAGEIVAANMEEKRAPLEIDVSFNLPKVTPKPTSTSPLDDNQADDQVTADQLGTF